MGIETPSGDVFRLIVALDVRIVVAVGCRFKRFEQAQTQVAEVVCRYARHGRVCAVALQRGRLNLAVAQESGNSLARPAFEDSDYNWTIEKRWGTEVIRRILRQHGIEPPRATVRPRLTSIKTARRPPAGKRAAKVAKAPRLTGRHKNTRWQVGACLAVIIVAMVALVFFQTGGHPSRLLSAITGVCPTVKDELPFDARTSFAPAPQPQTHERGSVPEHQDPRPGEGAQP
jgi:hypothetical protein